MLTLHPGEVTVTLCGVSTIVDCDDVDVPDTK